MAAVGIPIFNFVRSSGSISAAPANQAITGLQILFGGVISIAPIAWFWQETREFEEWVRQLEPTDNRKIERDYNLMTDYALKFWTAIIAVYAALLIKASH